MKRVRPSPWHTPPAEALPRTMRPEIVTRVRLRTIAEVVAESPDLDAPVVESAAC